jgi:hypothetical protein
MSEFGQKPTESLTDGRPGAIRKTCKTVERRRRKLEALVQKRIATDPAFAYALLRECIGVVLAGDIDTGKAILRYIKATAD